jgi:hypothetical protein
LYAVLAAKLRTVAVDLVRANEMLVPVASTIGPPMALAASSFRRSPWHHENSLG